MIAPTNTHGLLFMDLSWPCSLGAFLLNIGSSEVKQKGQLSVHHQADQS